MISVFYRHGILSDNGSMACLAGKLGEQKEITHSYNYAYDWKDQIVTSGFQLAREVLEYNTTEHVMLVGHSQGGLVCRVAAVALKGRSIRNCGPFTNIITEWQRCNGNNVFNEGERRLAVVTIATPNAGAMSFGQMSVAAELLGRTIMETTSLLTKLRNLEDLTTPRLFQEFEKWHVDARYLSISGVCVNRYSRGAVRNLAELWPLRRVSVRFDVPNDLLVEDSSTDLRQSLIRPEIDLTDNYRHFRAYPRSISLNHSGVRESDEVGNLIVENLNWLFNRGQ